MRDLTKRLWLWLFPIALVLPVLSVFSPLDRVEIDNRRLEPPPLTIDQLTEPSFYRESLAFLRDASPMRARLIQLSSTVDFYLLGDSPAPADVLLGGGGWLYGREAIEELCLPISPHAAVENLKDTMTFLNDRGINVIFTVAPAKFTVHPENLTVGQKTLAACSMRNHAAIRALLAEDPAPGYVDSWAIFEEVKATGVDPYFRTDTHFRHEAAIPWLEAIVTHIEPSAWDPNAIRDEGSLEFIGNLMTLIGLGEPEVVSNVFVDRGTERGPDRQLHDRFSDAETATHVYLNPESEQPLIEGSTVMLKDSFLDIPAESLAQHFRRLTLTDWRSGASRDFFVEQAVVSDTVILETSEEALLTRFADRGLLEQLMAAFGP